MNSNNNNENKKIELLNEIASKTNNGDINGNINIGHAYELVNKNDIQNKEKDPL